MSFGRKFVAGAVAVAVAVAASVVLGLTARADPDVVTAANAICRDLRSDVDPWADTPPAAGRRPPDGRRLQRTARALIPRARAAHRELLALGGQDVPDFTSFVAAYGRAVDRLAQLSSSGQLTVLHRDRTLRRLFAEANALAIRVGAVECAL
jgi:cytochrome P450